MAATWRYPRPMTRLFVALPIDPPLRDALAAAIPAAGPETRAEHPADLHLTLHFLGPWPVDDVADALTAVDAPPIVLTAGARGAFEEALWIGVDGGPALLDLRAAIAAALAPIGFAPEARAYTPHLTLGRTRDPAVRAAFLAGPSLDVRQPVDRFTLYESRPDARPRYAAVRTYALAAP